MKYASKKTIAVVLLVLLSTSPPRFGVALEFNNGYISGNIKSKTWKDLRDERVIKQEFDDSCGAASLATILSKFYGQPVSEQNIISALMDNGVNGSASFASLSVVAEQYGFSGRGLALRLEKLKEIKVPVIVYMKYKGTKDHFAVLRGISKDIVWLADPSTGNRYLTKHQFLELWETREDDDLRGKVLLIMPQNLDSPPPMDSAFFQEPKPRSLPVRMLTMTLGN